MLCNIIDLVSEQKRCYASLVYQLPKNDGSSAQDQSAQDLVRFVAKVTGKRSCERRSSRHRHGCTSAVHGGIVG